MGGIVSSGVSLITALFTLGGGVKLFSCTSNKYSTLKKSLHQHARYAVHLVSFPGGHSLRHSF